MDFYHYGFYRISKREEEGAGEEESHQQFPVKEPCCLSALWQKCRNYFQQLSNGSQVSKSSH